VVVSDPTQAEAGRTPGKSISFSTFPGSAISSWILTGIALFLVLKLHLLSALMAGLLTYELVRLLTPVVEKRLTSKSDRLAALELLLAMILLEAAFGTAGLIAASLYYAYIKNEFSDAGLI
jgi:hypothetical protein